MVIFSATFFVALFFAFTFCVGYRHNDLHRYFSSSLSRLAMFDPKIIDDISRRLSQSLPPGLASLEKDTRQHLNSALQSALSRMNLVTREEFDIQQAVLARTREKLEMLEKHVAQLEQSKKHSKQ
ncbi:MAG: accessory factor UbiK family protein [Pseudomonadota bacterium]|nr:accessory factor UbiK family protein [Pseudomonadota bacterium]